MKRYLHDLYKRKDLIIYLVASGLKAQHRNSFLGYFWWLLDPLLGVLVYYFVVVIVFRRAGGPDYGIYLVIGMIVWRWLSSTVSSASKSIISQSGIITQVYLPKAIFPIGATLTQLINFGFGLLVIAIFFIFFGIVPGLKILWLPIIVGMQFAFMMAIAFVLAYLCVFVRDIDNILNHLMRLWFFGSPVIWYQEMIPEKGRWLLNINPMNHFLAAYRNILMHNSNPDYMPLLYMGIISLMFVAVIVGYYNQYEHKIIKVL
jgi:ABC-type polysaccharide/polyol phosphate export permease